MVSLLCVCPQFCKRKGKKKKKYQSNTMLRLELLFSILIIQCFFFFLKRLYFLNYKCHSLREKKEDFWIINTEFKFFAEWKCIQYIISDHAGSFAQMHVSRADQKDTPNLNKWWMIIFVHVAEVISAENTHTHTHRQASALLIKARYQNKCQSRTREAASHPASNVPVTHLHSAKHWKDCPHSHMLAGTNQQCTLLGNNPVGLNSCTVQWGEHDNGSVGKCGSVSAGHTSSATLFRIKHDTGGTAVWRGKK